MIPLFFCQSEHPFIALAAHLINESTNNSMNAAANQQLNTSVAVSHLASSTARGCEASLLCWDDHFFQETLAPLPP